MVFIVTAQQILAINQTYMLDQYIWSVAGVASLRILSMVLFVMESMTVNAV
jgi:hypothetical protein